MTTPTDMHKVHHGRNIRRFREMLGLKQEALAAELGGDWTQRRISLLEGKELVEDDILKEVAGALKVPKEAIENFDEEKAINIIGNTVTTVNDHGTGQMFQFNPVINPIEKWMEALDEIKRLNAALIQEKDEKIKLLERMLAGK